MNRRAAIRHRWNDAIAHLPWQELERLVAHHYRQQGYLVEACGTGRTGKRTDGGIDLKLWKDDEYLIVECKHWNTEQVPHNDVHELLGIMATERATSAIFITSGEFTDAALRRTRNMHALQLIDGSALRQMLIQSGLAPIGGHTHLSTPSAFTEIRTPMVVRRKQQPRIARNGGLKFFLRLALALLLIWGGQQYLSYRLAHISTQQASTARARLAPSVVATRTVQAQPSIAPNAISPAKTQQAPQPKTYVPRTNAELHEWRRKNAESMEIIGTNTPEM